MVACRTTRTSTGPQSSNHFVVTEGAFKKVSQQGGDVGGDGSSPQNAALLTKRGDEAVPAPILEHTRVVTEDGNQTT